MLSAFSWLVIGATGIFIVGPKGTPMLAKMCGYGAGSLLRIIAEGRDVAAKFVQQHQIAELHGEVSKSMSDIQSIRSEWWSMTRPLSLSSLSKLSTQQQVQQPQQQQLQPVGQVQGEIQSGTAVVSVSTSASSATAAGASPSYSSDLWASATAATTQPASASSSSSSLSSQQQQQQPQELAAADYLDELLTVRAQVRKQMLAQSAMANHAAILKGGASSSGGTNTPPAAGTA